MTETCRRGHPWTPETIYLQPGRVVSTRVCRVCKRLAWRRWYYALDGRPVPETRPVHGPVADRVLAVLRERGSMTPDRLRAALGYRRSRRAVVGLVWAMCRRGLPVVAVRGRYALAPDRARPAPESPP